MVNEPSPNKVDLLIANSLHTSVQFLIEPSIWPLNVFILPANRPYAMGGSSIKEGRDQELGLVSVLFSLPKSVAKAFASGKPMPYVQNHLQPLISRSSVIDNRSLNRKLVPETMKQGGHFSAVPSRGFTRITQHHCHGTGNMTIIHW